MIDSQNKRKSLQDINKQRQQLAFVGRQEQISLFRRNLSLDPENSLRRFIFSISGQGGVGKSTLARQFRQISESVKYITAYTDHRNKQMYC
ncbi:hypothetical protein CAL7716_101540 (plasmid) [Calothrix sp. PCC 7716]|nr:hypothetical protein CAL7716_101540 [Calothrix sp. PCC 7716]